MIISCPHCTYTSELFRSISPGQTFICSECLSLFIFAPDITLREPTADEIHALHRDGEVQRTLAHLRVLHFARAAAREARK